MTSLLEDLERASEGSFPLDEKLLTALGFVYDKGQNCYINKADGEAVPTTCCPTRSRDDCAILTPHRFRKSHNPDDWGETVGLGDPSSETVFWGTAATEMLAWCAALIRAAQQKEKSDG